MMMATEFSIVIAFFDTKGKGACVCKSVGDLTDKYQQLLKLPEVVKYPKFSNHMQSLWRRRSEWAHCYHATQLIRGNHTNNYACPFHP